MPKTFSNALLSWYDKNKRDLPWRRTKDPYKIWVSEMMLQQTTVSTVIAFYERWFKLFPTLKHLAKADQEQVLKAWQGLGYYARARNLHKAAQIVLEQHQGVLPKDALIVRALPGFGPYATGAVLSIAYDLPLTIIDANVRRVMMRIHALPGLADAKQDKKIDEYLLKVFPKKRAGDFNQSLMELGAMVCRAKEPVCNLCPVKDFCLAFKQGKQEIIPQTKKKILKDVHAVIAIIKHKDKYFIQQRPSKGLLAGMWEFPGGKIKKGETKVKALARELDEELGVKLERCKFLFEVKHFYTEFRVYLSVFEVGLLGLPKQDAQHCFVSVDALFKYPMPSGSAKILEKLCLKW